MRASKYKNGFTIVELLIVIVVIGILAAITIVAYNGIQNRAKNSAAQSAASQASKKVMSYAALNSDTYPADLAASGVADSGDTSFQYSVNNTATPKTFCVTATTQNSSYWVSSASSTPTSGGCAGHGTGGVAAITNLAINPGVEAGISGLSDMGGVDTEATLARVNNWADSGAWSIQITKTVGAGIPKGVRTSITASLVVGDVVRWTVTVRNATASTKSFRLYGERMSPTYAGLIGSTVAVPAGATIRLTSELTITSANAGLSGFGVIPTQSYAVGESYYADSFVVTKNEALPDVYRDGGSPNWVWNGTINASSSTGPTP